MMKSLWLYIYIYIYYVYIYIYIEDNIIKYVKKSRLQLKM